MSGAVVLFRERRSFFPKMKYIVKHLLEGGRKDAKEI